MSDDMPTHWPTGVEPLTIDGSGKIGVHRDTGHLYWDGKRVSTVGRLAFPERALAVVATAATVSMALVDLVRFLNGN
ncbi:hypothetical protein [Phyllobacterium sp. UNC302MFCol5.2]|uniref:hypothetical protein n=1 Tax=Phyllobacterium sp. UNC302MFCol5.2 TaxID=1449065 RepID=UPI00048A20B3|nr:hypothetical protein [Phyllobacterium sp. UNC302MFCol5.2]